MLPCVCSATENSRRQNVIGTSATYSATPRVPLSSSYHVLTSSAICYWTEVRKHGIYLLIQILFNCEKRHTWQILRSTWSHVSIKNINCQESAPIPFRAVPSIKSRYGVVFFKIWWYLYTIHLFCTEDTRLQLNITLAFISST